MACSDSGSKVDGVYEVGGDFVVEPRGVGCGLDRERGGRWGPWLQKVAVLRRRGTWCVVQSDEAWRGGGGGSPSDGGWRLVVAACDRLVAACEGVGGG